ncbi:MAG: DMT family transporter [Cyanobacteria bacterium P01_H01_bin.15]
MLPRRFTSMTIGRIYLLGSVVLFAIANALVRVLIEVGSENPIDGRNPISFCNVLFVGNLCALAVFMVWFAPQLRSTVLSRLRAREWFSMTLVALFGGAIAPAFTFIALGLTAVNNVVLLDNIGPPVNLALSVWLLGERVNTWIVSGAALAFVGVVITIWLQPADAEILMGIGGMSMGRGETLAIMGAIAGAIAAIISKKSLVAVPSSLFLIYRTALGSLIFGALAIHFFGIGHFQDVLAPQLWRWMIVYGGVIVAGGFWLELAGLRRVSVGDFSLINAFSPLAGVLAAYFLLGEAPNLGHYLGGSIILLGLVCNHWGLLKRDRKQMTNPPELDMGFKGI